MKSQALAVTTKYALLFGLAGGLAVIGLLQFMLSDIIKVLPYLALLVVYVGLMKSKAPTATLKQLALGSTLMAGVATVIVYAYVFVFFWLNPANNPLDQTVPVMEHMAVLVTCVITGGAAGTLFALLFNTNWRMLKRA